MRLEPLRPTRARLITGTVRVSIPQRRPEPHATSTTQPHPRPQGRDQPHDTDQSGEDQPVPHQPPATTPDDPPFDPDYDATPPAKPAATATESRPGATNPAPSVSAPTSNGHRPSDREFQAPPSTPPEPPADGPAPIRDDGAERAVLGAILANPAHVIPAVSQLIAGSDYYAPVHELIHDTAVALHAAGAPVDPASVLAQLRDLKRLGELGVVGGPIYLSNLAADVALTTPSAAAWHAETVRTTARRRLLEVTGLRLTQLARTGPTTELDSAYSHAYDVLDAAVVEYGPTAHTVTSWSPVNLDGVLRGEHLDPEPVILRRLDGVHLFYAGAVHTLSGESESGKTWLALLAVHQELADGNACTFVDFEDRAERVVGRLLGLGAHPEVIRERFAYVRPDRPLDDQGRTQLAPALTGRTLVILDGVTEAMTTHGLDLNSNADSATFQAMLPRWIADHGPAVAMIDHVVKNREEQGRFAIGAQHKLAGIDGAAYIVKNHQPFARGKRGVSQIIVAKDRPGHVRERAYGKTIATLALDASQDGNVLVAELTPPDTSHGDGSGVFEPTHLMEQVSRYIEANPRSSKTAIETAVRGKTSIVRLALEQLIIREHVATIQGKNRAIHHVSVRPFRENPPDNPDDTSTDQPYNPGEDTTE